MVERISNRNSDYDWVVRSKRRLRVLVTVTQPMTVAQVARRTAMNLNGSCETIRELRDSGHVECLNPDATTGRVYWLTSRGTKIQRLLYKERDVRMPNRSFPEVDWRLYGRVCSTHRSIVVRTLNEPMQPARIKRRAYSRDPSIRMSANNTRDVIRFLLKYGVVKRVYRKKAAHPLYQLTTPGLQYQMLLRRARQRIWQR